MIGAIILLSLAAWFKAVADTLQHHYHDSIFKRKSSKFWNPAVSYKYVKFLPLTKYRADGWHLANSGMIICFIVLAALHKPSIAWYYEILIGGVYFNLTFNLFYNKVLR